ncbi:UDP-glycosyltransferase 83A1 [Linum perenne]
MFGPPAESAPPTRSPAQLSQAQSAPLLQAQEPLSATGPPPSPPADSSTQLALVTIPNPAGPTPPPAHERQHVPSHPMVTRSRTGSLKPRAWAARAAPLPAVEPTCPLVTDSQNSNLPGSFWRQDRTCLAWLDKHPPKSVVYVAFGSITVLTRHQFEELASGLEMTGRPFLWVVRTNFVEGSGLEFLDGFLKRVANRGKIVEWANQEEVLSHPSIACFLSHCGWNSVLDGLWSGIPFLCWPYFIDQFHNRESICEAWKVGLRLDAEDDATGLITSLEIASKVEQLLSDDDTIRGNAIRLRKLARESVNENGSSYHSFLSFIDNLCS